MFQKALMFFFAAKVALVTCRYESDTAGLEKQKMKVERTGRLAEALNECSGICLSPWSEHLLAINDSGAEAELYEISRTGKLIRSHAVPDAVNRDWEEITADGQGNVYIGDFGNNGNARKDLTIYKYHPDAGTQQIRFRYTDQTYRDGEKSEYDCEAFFWANDSLYLFTKSWEKGVKTSRLYVIPDRPGHYDAAPRDEILLKAQVTGAAISPGKDRFALITYGKVFLFGIQNGAINFRSPIACLSIARQQTEAILYDDANTLLFTNEQRGIFRIQQGD